MQKFFNVCCFGAHTILSTILSIWVIYKTFSHVTGCLYFNIICRPSACASTLEYILCVMFGDKITSDKAKINVIKNVKRRKLCFMML